jgi:pectate lyase
VRELVFVNNFYIPGPATKVFTLLKPDPGDPDRGMRAYMAGNVIEGRPEFDADNWKAAVLEDRGLEKVRAESPLWESYVTTQTARGAYESILADVGATVPKRDVIDARIVNDVRKRAHTFAGSKSGIPGIIDSQADVGGWPEYKTAEPPLDSDHDGVPDAWEKSHGMNPGDAADARKDAGDGYTYLEKYLNELAGGDKAAREAR